MAAANNDFVTETGSRVRPTGYNFFASLNTRRADLDLPQFDLPAAQPVFSRNPVVELAQGHLDSHLPAHCRLDGCPKSGPRPHPRPSRIAPLAPAALLSLCRPPQERV
jgi:hypothetical protein